MAVTEQSVFNEFSYFFLNKAVHGHILTTASLKG